MKADLQMNVGKVGYVRAAALTLDRRKGPFRA